MRIFPFMPILEKVDPQECTDYSYCTRTLAKFCKARYTLATELNSTRSTLLKVNCCRNRQQIGNVQRCCRFWQQIGNNVNLTACCGRLFLRYGRVASVYGARIQPLLDATRRSQQSGFVAGRSTIDAILALRLYWRRSTVNSTGRCMLHS